MTLPPRDPVLLFGEEALGDMKALRRAYARLLRTHGPEKDPEGFAVVQAAYAEACARLEAGPAEPAAPAPAEAWAAAEWGTWLRSALRTPEALREELARHAGEPAANVMVLATEGAAEPETVRGRLVQLLQRGNPGTHAYAAARIAFGLDGRLALEQWPSLSAELRGCAYVTPVDVARLDALLTANAIPEAWAHWQAVGPHLMATLAEVATDRYNELLGMAAWVVPEPELHAQRAWVQDVHLDLSDAVRDRLDRVVLVNLAVRRSAADPSANPNVVRAVQEAYGSQGNTRPEGVVAALLELHDSTPDLPRVLDGLAGHHPMLVAACERLLLMASGRLAFNEGRVFQPGDWTELAEELKGVEMGLEERATESSRRVWSVLAAQRRAWERSWKWWAAATFVAGSGMLVWPILGIVAGPALLGLIGTLTQRPSEAPVNPPRIECAEVDLAWARARCFELQARHGAWLHELALLSEGSGLHHVGLALDGCFRNRWHDLLALRPAHLRRARHPMGIAR